MKYIVFFPASDSTSSLPIREPSDFISSSLLLIESNGLAQGMSGSASKVETQLGEAVWQIDARYVCSISF